MACAEHVQRFKNWIALAGLDLKKHQLQGIEWVFSRELQTQQGSPGGFLCDEMGLGKTITMIGVIVANMKPTTLVVLPVALLYQWYAAIEKTTGHKAVIYHGSREKKKHSIEDLKKAPVVLTTYGSVVMDAKKNDKLSKIKWDRIIFDEAHHLPVKSNNHFTEFSNIKGTQGWLEGLVKEFSQLQSHDLLTEEECIVTSGVLKKLIESFENISQI